MTISFEASNGMESGLKCSLLSFLFSLLDCLNCGKMRFDFWLIVVSPFVHHTKDVPTLKGGRKGALK